jgi:hypothetical protein
MSAITDPEAHDRLLFTSLKTHKPGRSGFFFWV